MNPNDRTTDLSRLEILVVVPALNEEATIANVIQLLRQETSLDVLVVSDGSQDQTANISKQCGAKVLDLCVNLGVGGALRAGFSYAIRNGYKAVIQVDADGQHPVAQIDDLIKAAGTSDADLILGSRFRDIEAQMAVSKHKRLVMKILAWSASMACNTRITDATSGFRLIREPLLSEFSRQFPSNYLGDTYEALLAAGRAGYSVIEIPVLMVERKHGESTSTFMQSVKFIIKGLTVATLRLHPRIRPKQF